MAYAKLPSDTPEKQQSTEEALTASYRASMRIQAMRMDGIAYEASYLRHELSQSQHQLSIWQHTLSWRLTAPLRIARHLSKGQLPTGRKISDVYHRLQEIYQDEGAAGIRFRISHRLARSSIGRAAERLFERKPAPVVTNADDRSKKTTSSLTHEEKINQVYSAHISQERLKDFTPRILIIAELSLRQCAKYRVWQKEEQLRSLGWLVDVVDWRETEEALSALQVCTEIIFYRVPAFPAVEALLKEARRLELSPWWEVDDLIFSAEDYKQNGNLASLDRQEQEELLFGVRLFRKCLLSCDKAIASTRVLAQAMQKAGIEHTVVIENALDQQTLDVVAAIQREGVPQHDTQCEIRIVYGSGTRTHDADFRLAATGILAAMQVDTRLTLHIIGDLTLPSEFDAMGDRVQTQTGLDYAAYMKLLAQADITIAPLEPTIFNDAKSNIKFLEAAVLSLPVICSPRDAFMQIVQDGKNGLVAQADAEWRDAILKLAADSTLRSTIGDQARKDVLGHYSPEAIVKNQVLPVFGKPDVQQAPELRILCVNIYYEPRSFGGATFVAEEMTRQLQRQENAKVAVFTSCPALPERGKSSIRYCMENTDILGVFTPSDHDSIAGLDNTHGTQAFKKWVEAFRPSVVHFHATQGLGLGCVRVCMEKNIPYVITLHDAWWLCERQFMVKADGHYCFQEKINLHTCQLCVPHARHLAERQILMTTAMQHAALLLTPSAEHRALFIANGMPADKICVNRNGFLWPKSPHAPRAAGQKLRFGYVGGKEEIKGYSLVKRAFESLKRDDWELLIVDNKLNLGIKSVYTGAWKTQGQVSTIPAYTRETIDAFFNSIDVLLFPSQWKESYGLTVREALSRDVWVISTAPGGQAEDIEDGVNGTLIPIDGRPETLQMAVENLLDTPGFMQDYVNPNKATLATFEQQSAELGSWLREVVHVSV
ncbi:glycosyltransferase [Acetobacter oryzoeni]|uniref:Glycosyltransferase n=1 Tax=Acetobacter oryzoeni TaxID=2500548 RepID=A0A5B9GP56_9PROT|nr:glycosyltransferase [Acetobacter oryzoeni]MCP1203153.1 glycosyltransferase [Acetobacter oryzoeni]QEE86496.1 glycosyltransferase [Acetobacter oryzoeni]